MVSLKYNTPEELAVLTQKSMVEIRSLIKTLKKKKPKNLDEVVHQMHDEFFAVFDCLDCANCCKTIGPRLIIKDIDRLAKHLKMKPQAFIEQYVEIDEDNDYVFRDHPCPFLLPDNYCMVYENRPKACLEYPHTRRKRFVQILDLSHKNCETCPVVFEIFERLKQK
jgi:Fe-S-cluster containining protein